MFRTILIGFFFLQAAGACAEDNSFFAARREALMKKIEGAVAVLQGAPDTRAYAAFRQDNNFYYLTGVEMPNALLLLDASNITPSFFCRLGMKKPNDGKARVFCRDRKRAVRRASMKCWNCPVSRRSWKSARMLSGFCIFLFLPRRLPQPAGTGLCSMIPPGKSDPWDGRPSRESAFEKNLQAKLGSSVRIKDLSPLPRRNAARKGCSGN